MAALDLAFTAAFTIEAAVKVAAMGLIEHQSAYLRSSWNALDAIVVAVSVVSLAAGSATKDLRALRALRALRPLRLLSRVEGMRVVVSALSMAVKPVLAVCALGKPKPYTSRGF